MTIRLKLLQYILIPAHGIFSSCVSSAPNASHLMHSSTGQLLAEHPSRAQRQSDIANEQSGDYFIGRRYFVRKTTFWGFLRKPGEAWETSTLVVMNEDLVNSPDRLPESGPSPKHGFDQNFEYKIWGRFTGESVYEPNTNRFLTEFKLKRFELIERDPGWLFSPKDRYSPNFISLGMGR